MGMKADGVLYLAAEFIDTFNEINKQVEKGAIKVAKNNQIKLSVDEKSLLTSIDKSLGSKSLKGFDLSGVIIPYLKKFSEEAPDNELGRKIILKKLQDDIGLVDIVKGKAVKNNNLKAMSADDIASAIEEINSLIYEDKLKSVNESPVKAVTEIFLKHASNIKAEIQKQLLEEFGENVSKYGVSEKEANDKLSGIYDSLAKRAEKEFELGGRKNKVRLEDVATEKDLEKIQGYYSRLESLGSPISGKSKELGDMLMKLSDDVDSFREGLDDELYELSEDIYSYTEREKKLFEDVRKKSYVSSRDKVKPTYSKNKEDTIEPIIETLPFTESTKKKDTVQDNKTQENNKALEQAKEITEAENKTTNIKKEQTQEIKKQNELLQEQKDKEKSLNKENTSQKTSKSSKPKLNKDFANDIADIFNLMQQEGTIPLSSSQKQVDEIEEEKEQAEQVTEEKERTVEKTKEQAQVEQQVTDKLKEQKNVQQSLQEDSQENKKKSELETLEDIKKETKQITDQEQKTIKAKEESLKVTQEELKTEQEINDKKEKSAAPIDSIRPDSAQPLLNKENGETLATKEKKDQEEIQQKIVESKNKELKITEEIAEAEKQITTENQKQEEAEEKKPLIMLVNKGRKLADVKTKGKSNSQIQAQLEAKKREKAKPNKKQSSDDTEQTIDKTEEAAAAAAAEADMKAAEAQKAKEDAEILAKLRKAFGVTENKANEESIQQIEVSSEQMQKLKKEIQEATESLKEYKEINDKIAKAQADKDNYVISQQTIDEMVQAGALSSSVDMAEYIRSAYRLYKKSGNEDDEKVLKEALRQYKLPTKKKKYLSYLTDEKGKMIKDENGEYKTEIKIDDAYREEEYLYSKNGKKLKSYANDERYKQYIKQADDERRAYEKAQRKLPSLLDERQAGQKDFAEASTRIQQVLQETGLDAERVNEILAAINGNLTDEEAIWKVINSYIKEASVELGKQQNISEDVSTLPDSSTASASTSKSKPSSIPSVPQIPNVSNVNINQSEIDSGNEASNEARGFNLISVSAEGAAEAKKNFVEANKEVKQSANDSVDATNKENKSLKEISKQKKNKDTKKKQESEITSSEDNQSELIKNIVTDLLAQKQSSKNSEGKTEKDLKAQLESKYSRLAKQKDFIQDNDISQKFLIKYSDIEATEDIQSYIDLVTKLGTVKKELKGYFDLDNLLIDDNKLDDATSALSSYFDLLEALRELRYKITGESSKETNLLESFTEQKTADLTVQKYKENLEKGFKKISSSKDFIQENDTSQEFLTKYADIEATDKMQEYVKNSLLIAQTKNQLSEYFDKEGNYIKKTYDGNGDLSKEIEQAQDLLNLYNNLINTKEKLELEITSKTSSETMRSLSAKTEQELRTNIEKDYKKLFQSKGYIQNNLEQRNFIDKYNGVISTDNTKQFNEALLKQSNIKNILDKQFDKTGTLIGDPDEVQKLLKEYNELSNLIQRLKLLISADDSKESIALKVDKDAQKAKTSLESLERTITNTFSKISNTKEFIQGGDINNAFLKSYEGISKGNDKGYKATTNLRELKNLSDELVDVKTKLKVSFDEAGNLKSSANPFEVQGLLNKYDELVNKIQNLKTIIQSPSSQESFLLEEFKQITKAEKEASDEAENFKNKTQEALNKTLTDKNFASGKDTDITTLDSYFKVGSSDNLDKVRSTVAELKILKEQLKASRADDGSLIGEPKDVSALIERYNTLSKTLQSLIVQIKLPNSSETIGLKIAEDAEKAEKELDELKAKVDTVIGKSSLFETQTLKTINAYGAFNGEEGKRTDLITPDKLGEKYGDRFAKQQEQVQQLISKFREYKTAVEELETLRTSDNTTLEQLTEANDKVKNLKDNITTLSQTIKTSGIANASEEQLGALKNRLEIFLEKNPNLTLGIRQQIQEYIDILNSGASVSKTRYASMTADLNKFAAAQTSGTTIWEQMVGKMREGIAFLATKFSFYEIFNQFRQGFEVIHQFDDALTEMMKVSDETRLSLERYQKTTFDTADAIGTNALQIQNSTADFMRLGETLNEAAESAKSANVLMNVSEFQSIDEATKSLIAMSAAYDDLSKMNIIDKLNEVGNNFSISTSEAAEALQSSASALQTAGNSMDESLALITAGNAVVQDANKVGTGMRTIALRLTGTKTAKEQLEEMGEETENVITTQSKLRDTIKEATAVASNGFKGFDILDDNGNYKSTYEIMLGIADVYDEIVETDKQLGRNNANLLLESVAGKNRANIAASIFQNPQLLKDAYKSSQEANGSAMRENEKYVQSISGHIAQLKNAWQEMWANAANRDVINFFIDAAKAVVNLANAVGVLPTTFALMLPYLNIITKVRSKDNKGIVTQFLDWANGLNEAQKAAKEMATAQEGLNAVKEAGIAITTAETVATEAEAVADAEGAAASATKTIADEAQTASSLELAGAEAIETAAEQGSTAADIEGAAASAGKTAANLAEAGSNAAAGASGFGQLGATIGGKLSAGIGRLTGAFSGLVGTIGAVPVGLGLVAGALLIGKKVYDAHRESVFEDAKATAENIKTQQEATTQQIESYKQLKTQLDSGDLSEQETTNVKQQILDIQKSINDQYGTAAQNVDLINGELEEQVNLLNSISEKEAQSQYYKDYEGFQVAKEEYNKSNRRFNFSLFNTGDGNLDRAISDKLIETGVLDKNSGAIGIDTYFGSVRGTASEAITTLEKSKNALEELKKEYRDPDALRAIDKQIGEIETQIGSAYEIVDKYEETILRGLQSDLVSNNKNGYDIYKNYQSSVSNLEDAYITGDTKKINEARKAFDEASIAKDKFLSISGNEQFALLFSKIDTSLIDAKNRFQDTVDLLKDIPEPKEQDGLFEGDNKKVLKENAKAQSKLTKEQKKAYKAAKELYSLNPDKVDIKATLDNNTYASGKYADALNNLMNAMGWTSADADNLISALITAGIVQGDAADIANIASGSYDAFSSSVETAIGALSTLNTALSESAKGTGITEQTLTELKSAFGDNLNSVLETTANGYHLNVEGAYLLRQQQEALTNADYASAVYEQYQALEKLQEGYLKAKEAGEDTSGYVQQRQAIQANIDKLNEDLMAFNNANSAYQTWLSKQSSEGEREMYNSIYSGYDAVKDELNRGWAGEKTRSWLDLIFNDEGDDSFDAWTSSAEEVKEKFDEVTKDIEGTGGYSIADFFTVDANGKSTSQGIWNFFEAVENKQDEVGEKFVDLEEGIFNFGKNGDYQIADLLGMDVESVQGILRAAADAGFEIHLDQPLYSLEQLEKKAYSAKDALEETMGTKLKINLDPQSEEEVDDAMQKLMQYQQTLSEDTSIDPNIKTERLQQIADLMNFMAAKKREFVEGDLFNFKIDIFLF